MESKYALKNIDIVNLLFLVLTPVAAVVFTYLWVARDGFDYKQLLLGLFFYFLTGLSVTAGYHRLFSHKAYDAHPLIKFFFLVFGAASFQNSILKWGSDHRRHHFKVDTEEDPYSITEGFFHAHVGWVFLKKNGIVNEKFARDYYNDPLIMWQHKYYLLISVLVGIGLPTLVGGYFLGSYLGGLAIGAFARIVLTHHCTFFINSLCHYIGSTPYTDTNSAKDSWFMALLTFGEGYHNFHHYFQTDYRNGIRWFHFDPTKWLIKSLSLSGLAYKLKLTPQDKILAAQMQMRLKEIQSKVGFSETMFLEVEKLKEQILENLHHLQLLKEEYKRTKVRELKVKIALTKEEFEKCMEQWELLVRNYQLQLSPATAPLT